MRNYPKFRLDRRELSRVTERRIRFGPTAVRISAILIDGRTPPIDIKLSRRLFIGLIEETLSVIDRRLKSLSFFAISRTSTFFLSISNPKLPLIFNPILFSLSVVMTDWSCWKFGDEMVSQLAVVEIIDVLILRVGVFKRWTIAWFRRLEVDVAVICLAVFRIFLVR